ncbi:hypothetical protein BDZ45DRAFT_371704 [Acephala macrosclerotiorum]|nr:hypothetical protein BDZ45DRAFT_371704 [Acephala macrosclerotiorum]
MLGVMTSRSKFLLGFKIASGNRISCFVSSPDCFCSVLFSAFLFLVWDFSEHIFSIGCYDLRLGMAWHGNDEFLKSTTGCYQCSDFLISYSIGIGIYHQHFKCMDSEDTELPR